MNQTTKHIRRWLRAIRIMPLYLVWCALMRKNTWFYRWLKRAVHVATDELNAEKAKLSKAYSGGMPCTVYYININAATGETVYREMQIR